MIALLVNVHGICSQAETQIFGDGVTSSLISDKPTLAVQNPHRRRASGPAPKEGLVPGRCRRFQFRLAGKPDCFCLRTTGGTDLLKQTSVGGSAGERFCSIDLSSGRRGIPNRWFSWPQYHAEERCPSSAPRCNGSSKARNSVSLQRFAHRAQAVECREQQHDFGSFWSDHCEHVISQCVCVIHK